MDEGKGFIIIININFLNFNDTSYFKKSHILFQKVIYRFVYISLQIFLQFSGL